MPKEVVNMVGTNIGGTVPESYCDLTNKIHYGQRVIWGNCHTSDNPLIPNCTCCDPEEFILSWCLEHLPQFGPL